MSPTGLDYISGNVPGGVFLLTGLLAVIWFVLWFVYYYSKLLRLSRLVIVGIFCSIALCFGYAYFWLKYPPPQDRERILIISNTSPGLSGPFLEMYLYQTYFYEFLKSKIDLSQYLVYKPDWTLSIANRDSLKYPNYRSKLARFMNAGFIFLIKIKEPGQRITCDLILQTKSTKNDTIYDVLSGSLDSLIVSNEVLDLFSIDPTYSKIYTSRWSRQAQKFWVKGKLARLSNDISTASKHYKHCLEIQKDFYPAQIELAQAAIDSAQIVQTNGGYYQNYLAKTMRYLYQLRDQKITSADAYRIWGEHAILSENFVVAEQKLKESFRLDRFNDKLYLDLAQLHPSRYQNLKFLNEEALLKQALFFNPASVQARIQYSDYLKLHSRYEESENILLQFLEEFPDNFDILLTLGKYYISRQNYAEADSIFHKMLNGPYPDKMPVEFNLGIVYFHQDDFISARKYFSRVASQNLNPDAFLYLATIYEKEGNLDKAIEYLRKRIRHNYGPQDRFKEEARKRLVLLLKQQKEFEN